MAAVVIFVVWMEWGGALLLLQLFLYSPVCLFLEEMEEVEGGGGYGGGTRAFKRLTMMMGALVLSGAHWPPLIRAIIATVTHTHTHTHTQTTTTKNRRNALGRH